MSRSLRSEGPLPGNRFVSFVRAVRAGEAKLREGAGRVASEAGAGEMKMCSSSASPPSPPGSRDAGFPIHFNRETDPDPASRDTGGRDPAARDPGGPDPASQDAGLRSVAHVSPICEFDL